ncbi:hypothetical protein EVAR_12469_1 [Eumeta japonica]|uniref:Uncharacterized protein n=1 Tax=Eumeta variegata TaxID=151549 RepID=A0A4C1TPG1_EUMVA|nr:hypothetical protein EVAR_12469_1 [Eumeta japonica]
MALVNFSSVGFGVPSALEDGTHPVASAGPLRVPLDDLLYSPADHQPADAAAPHRHDPYAPPGDSSAPTTSSTQTRAKLRKRAGTAYLPPPNQFTHYPHENNPYAPRSQLHTRVFQQQRLDQRIAYDNTGQYVHDPSGDYDFEQRRGPDSPTYLDPPYGPTAGRAPPSPAPTTSAPATPADRPPGFTKVEPGGSGSKTQLHAVLDYDEDYYDDVPGPESGESTGRPSAGCARAARSHLKVDKLNVSLSFVLRHSTAGVCIRACDTSVSQSSVGWFDMNA